MLIKLEKKLRICQLWKISL